MKNALLLFLFTLLAIPMPANGQAWSKWLQVETPSGQFSAEIPCTPSEVELLGARPADLNIGVSLEPDDRVLCLKDGVLFLAGVVKDPSFEQLETSIFDWVRNETLAVESRNGVARDSTLDGRRAFMNREKRESNISETGFIEIDKTTVIMFLAGGPYKKEDQITAAIDRFAQSIQVASK